MIKISNEVDQVRRNAERVAVNKAVEIITVAFLEKALIEEYTNIFESVIGKEKTDTLKNKINLRVDGSSRINPSTVERYKRMGEPLPIRVDISIQNVYNQAFLYSQSEWVTGELSLSHFFAALCDVNGKDTCISAYFRGKEKDQKKIRLEFMKIEAEEYGLDIDDYLEEAENAYVTNLIEKVKEYKKPFVGREDIIENVIRTLCRMDKCNPVCVGEPGVGKTAIVYGLARKILEGNVPKQLKDAELYSVDLAGMLAGAKFRGEFEERLKSTLEEMSEKENVILFFDEIHNVVGTGASSDNPMDAANIIKPILTEGKIKFIGATTYDEYGKYIEKDKALARRFQKIDVVEPSIEDATKIIMGLKEAYEEYHGVKYTNEAIKAAVNLSAKYIHDRFLPDKAIDIIDEAGAHHSIHNELGNKINDKAIEDVMVKICKVHAVEAKKDEMQVVNTLSKKLSAKVYGQANAIEAVSEAVKLAKSGLGDEEKPIASFLFVGPSGVGKTEIAKQLANSLDMNLIRIDMSEYSEKHSVSKIFGTSAGYIGYDDGGVLTGAVLKQPNSVLLLDEIEKAHPDIFTSFLQVLDYGRMTDNKGRKVDFRNCIIIMTSNAGATVAAKKPIGIMSEANTQNKDGIMDAVNNVFTPEFRNRLSGIVIFNGINEEIGSLIVRKELKALTAKLKNKKIIPEFTDACVTELTRLGVSDVYGAREVQRVIDKHIKKMFVDRIIANTLSGKCIVDFKDGEFSVEEKKLKHTLAEMVK